MMCLVLTFVLIFPALHWTFKKGHKRSIRPSPPTYAQGDPNPADKESGGDQYTKLWRWP